MKIASCPHKVVDTPGGRALSQWLPAAKASAMKTNTQRNGLNGFAIKVSPQAGEPTQPQLMT